jgi:hypothetical protein
MPTDQVPPLQQQVLKAFEHDLPRLWTERPGQWVAYQGERPVAFGTQKLEVYQHCLHAGLHRDEFVVFCIEPQETDIVMGLIVLD